jgi:hypothetical protein
LLALGLGWLARRRARARYCQPITS